MNKYILKISTEWCGMDKEVLVNSHLPMRQLMYLADEYANEHAEGMGLFEYNYDDEGNEVYEYEDQSVHVLLEVYDEAEHGPEQDYEVVLL